MARSPEGWPWAVMGNTAAMKIKRAAGIIGYKSYHIVHLRLRRVGYAEFLENRVVLPPVKRHQVGRL
jgi:hypothetical protein